MAKPHHQNGWGHQGRATSANTKATLFTIITGDFLDRNLLEFETFYTSFNYE